jgi:hypothetical protein
METQPDKVTETIWTQFADGNPDVVALFKSIASDASFDESTSIDHKRLASAFSLYRFDSPYIYTPVTLVETLGLLTSKDGYEVFEAQQALPKDRSYSIQLPEKISRLGIEFVARTLHEVRSIICTGKFKPTSRSASGAIPALVSGLASSITASLDISSTLATGVAATVLVVVSQAAHKSFCDMTDDEVIKAVEKRTGATRRTGA